MKKTNAARFLDNLNIEYRLMEYEVDESNVSAEAVANKTNLPLEQVFKTLVAQGRQVRYRIGMYSRGGPVGSEEVVEISGNKKVEMVPVKEIQALTGYIRGGVSPIGTKKHYPVYLDESALKFPFVAISAGVRGCQILLDPKNLSKAVEAQFSSISRSDE